ncbi:MAG: rhodanese-like domain-containing protein [Nannocystaceae bacterium]
MSVTIPSSRFFSIVLFASACGQGAAPPAAKQERRPVLHAEVPAATVPLVDPSTHVNVAQAQDLLRPTSEVIVLDVRTPAEFAVGHLANAVNIDVRDASFNGKIAALDRSKSYLVHCSAGVPRGRSLTAVSELGKLGFPKLYHLDGGFSAWQLAGQPVEP